MIRFAIRALLCFLLAGPASTLETRAAERGAPQIHSDLSVLPELVKNMRDAILEAARSGNIDALRPVLESNELKPTVSFGGADDPIEHWKQASRDGQGFEIMAIMTEILEMDFARINAGTSNEMYIWPYLAELPLDTLTPAQQVDLTRLMKPEEVKTMKEFGGYIYYRLGIGRDGTWHYFVAGD
jgi:hypothetical protein